MQRSLITYYNAFYPPGYSQIDVFRSSYLNIKEYAIKFLNDHKVKTFTTLEYDVYKYVNYYMGRTKWDHALVNILSPGSSYYHVEEALRDIFLLTLQRHGKYLKMKQLGFFPQDVVLFGKVQTCY